MNNQGLTRSLIDGCHQARGRYIARLDADDRCLPHRLRTQADYLDAHPDITALGSWAGLIDHADQPIGAMQPVGDPALVGWEMCWGSTLCHSSVMIRAGVLQQVGSYNADYRLAQDYELWTRLLMAGHRIAILPEPLVDYRRSANQIVAARHSEHSRVAMGLISRYTHWLTGRHTDPAVLRAARSLMYDAQWPRHACRLSEVVRLYAQTLAYWQQRLSTEQAEQLEQHVHQRLLQLAQQFTYQRPGRGSALTMAMRHHLPSLAGDRRMWRQLARLPAYGTRWCCRTAPKLTARWTGRQTAAWMRSPVQTARQQTHRLAVRRRAAAQIRQLQTLRRRLSRHGPRAEIIAIDLIGGMGDILTCEPVARQIRRQHPAACLVWCAHRSMVDLVAHHPCIDHVLPMDCFGQRRLLAASGLFDDVIDLYIPGWGCDRCGVYKPIRPGGMHHSNYYDFGESNLAVMCCAAGISTPTDQPRVYLPAEVVQQVDRMGIPQPYVVIHGKSGEAARDWPAEQWQAVAEKLVQARVHVVEVGVSPTIRMASHYYHNHCGRPLLVAGELIRRAGVFVGVDSGPAHFGNALGVPAVIVLGHFRGFQHRYIPYHGRYRDQAWADLIHADGPLTQLAVDPVIEAVVRRLHQPRQVMAALPGHHRATTGG